MALKRAAQRAAAPLLLALGLLALAPGCETISQLNLIPVEQDPALGAEAYPQLLADESIISSGPQYQKVVSLTDRLVRAAQETDPEIANMFEWEVKLVRRDDLVNAWCLPGGKMAVYTGILPVASGATGDFETGLAVVMGHEIAHATLRHGTRAMTRQMGASALVSLLSIAVGASEGQDAAAITAAAGALATNFANLSFGRDAELEADRRGLLYMARAGYDPRAAVDFWQRMAQASGGAAPPEWLSTHPTNARRIDQIRALLPEVLPVYEQSGGSSDLKSFDG